MSYLYTGYNKAMDENADDEKDDDKSGGGKPAAAPTFPAEYEDMQFSMEAGALGLYKAFCKVYPNNDMEKFTWVYCWNFL